MEQPAPFPFFFRPVSGVFPTASYAVPGRPDRLLLYTQPELLFLLQDFPAAECPAIPDTISAIASQYASTFDDSG